MFPSTPLDFLTIIFIGAFLLLLGYDLTGPDEGKDEHEVPVAAYVFIGLFAAVCLVAEPIWPLPTGESGTFFQMVGMATIAGGAQQGGAQQGGGVTPAQSLKIQFVAVDTFTKNKLGGTSAIADVLDPSSNTAKLESITADTSTKIFTSSYPYAPGTRLRLHIYSTEGNRYYDGWFEDVVVPSVATEGNWSVGYYWLGSFALYNRESSSKLSLTLTNSTGYALSSATGASAGSAGFMTAQGTTVTLKVNIYLGDKNVAWGQPMQVLTSTFALQERKLVAWLAVNNTAISADTIRSDGWTLVPNYAVGYLTFYKVMDPVVSDQSTYGSDSYQITLDTSAIASAKNVTVSVWVADVQNPEDAKSGTYNPIPSSFSGAFSGCGLNALLPANGYIRLSGSNVPTGAWLSCKIRTA